MHAIETIVERVAVELQMDPAVVREANFYSHKVAITPYKLPMVDVHIQEVSRRAKAKEMSVQCRSVRVSCLPTAFSLVLPC